MKKHLTFIVNPISGIGKQKRIERIIEDNLDHEKFDYTVRYTERIHHGTDIAHELAEQKACDAVVAVGGDGSINDAISGLRGYDMPLGIIPCGSGNGLARNLKIPLIPTFAIKLLNQFYVAPIDTITVNDHIFASIAGIGFDALVARKMKLAKHRGLQGYTNIIVAEYPAYQEREYHLLIDGQEIRRKAWFISFANSNQFGFNAAIAPLAQLDDGLMDVCIVDKIPLAHLPLTAPLVYLNHFDLSQHVEIFKAKEVRVLNNDYRWVNIDGEGECVGKELLFTTQPKSLNIICRDPNQKPLIIEDMEKNIKNIGENIKDIGENVDRHIKDLGENIKDLGNINRKK